MRWIAAIVVVCAGLGRAQSASVTPPAASPVAPAQAEYAMVLGVSNRVTAANPSCTVFVRAQWDPGLYTFNVAYFEVDADADAGAFSDPQTLLKAGGTHDGTIGPGGDSVTQVVSGQFCPFFGCDPGACPDPMDIWRVTWSADDFTPRVVSLVTVTSEFKVFTDDQCFSESFLDQLVEGAGQIVITCPGDCDQSTGVGVLDIFDFLCFVNEFNAWSPDADCDADGALSLFDFLCFVNAFNGGC